MQASILDEIETMGEYRVIQGLYNCGCKSTGDLLYIHRLEDGTGVARAHGTDLYPFNNTCVIN